MKGEALVSLNFKLMIGIAVGLFAYYAYVNRQEPAIDLSLEEYGFGDRVSPHWQKVCLLGQQEIPSVFVSEISDRPCDLKMGWEMEVPSGRVLMVYFYDDKQCEIQWFSGYFVAEDRYETRCLGPDDVKRLSLHHEDGIINLRPK